MGTTADKLNKLKETKQAIKTAIVNKGVEVTDTDTFASYASKIDSIQTGGTNLGFEDIGYAYTPTFITDGLNVGKQAYDSFNPNATTWNEAFPNIDFKSLVFFPKITLQGVLKNEAGGHSDNLSLPKLEECIIFPDIECNLVVYGKSDGFSNSYSLKSVHINGDFLNVNNSRGFNNCSALEDLVITGKIKSFGGDNEYFLAGCRSINIIDYDFDYGGSYIFANMGRVEEIKRMPPISEYAYGMLSGTDVGKIVPLDLSKIGRPLGTTINAESIDYCEEINMDSITGNPNLRYITNSGSYLVFKNLGNSQNTTVIYASIISWGYTSTIYNTKEQSRQSFMDSFVTYSFDRATAGWTPCTVNISSYFKALLTEDEIAQITAKGFTIA